MDGEGQVDYDGFEPERIQHLEMIQAVITRLSNEGFLVKGWAITVAGAFLGFAVTKESWALALASVIPTIAFWYLDGTFLRSEWLFRALHKHVQRKTRHVKPFEMAATSETFVSVAAIDPGNGIDSLRTALRRPAVAALYGCLVLAALAVTAILAATGSSGSEVVPVHLV
jgi:hypothetical protein